MSRLQIELQNGKMTCLPPRVSFSSSPTTFSPTNPHTHTTPSWTFFLIFVLWERGGGEQQCTRYHQHTQRNNKPSQTTQSHPLAPWCNQTGKMFSVELEFRANSAILPGNVRLTSYQKNYWRKIKGGEPSLRFTFVVLLLSLLPVCSLMLLLCSCVHVSKRLSWLQ